MHYVKEKVPSVNQVKSSVNLNLFNLREILVMLDLSDACWAIQRLGDRCREAGCTHAHARWRPFIKKYTV